MDRLGTVKIYMGKGLRERVQSNQHNFIHKMVTVLQNAGFSVEYCLHEEAAFPDKTEFTLSHMKPPPSGKGLIFRRVYHYPFWQIDRSEKRWEWGVALENFDPAKVNPKQARPFYSFWRKRLFQKTTPAQDEGFIYMPLQGRLGAHRSFQSCAPMEMIERCLATFPDRKIIATLHPNEIYSQIELNALEKLENTYAGFHLRRGQMETLLDRCACVVTQNSSAAFNGYFFAKPAVLFGKVDFHHIALNGMDVESYEQIRQHRPSYAEYIYWFWQEKSINAGHPTAEDKILKKFKNYEWIK